MPVAQLRLRISTPTEPIPPGRGFYQLEEDALYVQIGLFSARRHFYSFLENDLLRLDLDKTGRLIFFEVSLPRRRWPVEEYLTPPTVIEPADIRWLEFRDRIPETTLATNKRQGLLRIGLSDQEAVRNYYLAKDVIVQVDQLDRAVAFWVTDIVDDLAGQEIGAFRKKNRSNDSFFD